MNYNAEYFLYLLSLHNHVCALCGDTTEDVKNLTQSQPMGTQ